jgi:hypothetical protein
MNRMEKIVDIVVEESYEVAGTDEVGRLYNVMMKVDRRIIDLMKEIRRQEREGVNETGFHRYG